MAQKLEDILNKIEKNILDPNVIEISNVKKCIDTYSHTSFFDNIIYTIRRKINKDGNIVENVLTMFSNENYVGSVLEYLNANGQHKLPSGKTEYSLEVVPNASYGYNNPYANTVIIKIENDRRIFASKGYENFNMACSVSFNSLDDMITQVFSDDVENNKFMPYQESFAKAIIAENKKSASALTAAKTRLKNAESRV